MDKIFKSAIDVIFPAKCLACRKKTGQSEKFGAVCEKCFGKIEINNCFFCPACGRRLFENKKFCHKDEKFVLAAACSYQDETVRELIRALKYGSNKNAAEPLAEILNSYLEKISRNDILPNLIVPVPLHPRRERKRGFNQSVILARKLKNNPEIATDVLIRIKNTPSQTKLKNDKERRGNISNGFSVKDAGKIAGKNIVVFDDVFTSGATMREAVRVLKEAGAKKITGLVIAKT